MESAASFGPRIDVRGELDRDRAAFLQLLHELAPEDWERPTAAAPWVVRDVVTHVLGDDVGRLARTRDRHGVAVPAPGEPFPAFIHRMNEEWVRAAARMSPRVLIELIEATTPAVSDLWWTADLDATGAPVSWAGPEPAPVWLDCARDFTEYWIHQQQIREAVDRPGGDGPPVVRAVLDTFLRAMPLTLSRWKRPAGSTLSVVVPGDSGGRWSWRQDGEGWRPAEHTDAGTATVVIGADALWRLCVRMVDPHDVPDLHVTGDPGLAAAALQIVSIIH